jgi:DNA mismatch repair protein PMS2
VSIKRGTTVVLKGLFHPLPVRRKELERNIKREFAKALNLLIAYALLPCATEPGIRLTATNQSEKGTKTQQLVTHGTPSMKESVTALWGPKALDNIVDLDLEIEVEKERGNRKFG